jgi:dCMP deaminase
MDINQPRTSRDETLMQISEVIGNNRGTCQRLHVGAVISRGGRIISTGYNGRPSGMTHCDHKDDEPCRLAVHAEANAIAFAARYGVAVEGAEIHTTHQPCLECAKLIVNAGLARVVFWMPYRDDSGLNLLAALGVATMKLRR